MTEFTGVRQPEFDTMASKHTEAGRRLEELAQALHGELTSAGLDPAPAARLRQLAGRVTSQAEDLRRRQKLVHELAQQKITFGRSTAAGSFLEIPDDLDTAKGLLEGTLAGRAALRAANGDAAALAELEKYASRAGDPAFAKSFLTTLGARGVTRLPGSLALALRDATRHQDTERATRLSGQGKKTLSMLSTILAKGTNPKSPAYAGADFLKDLVTEGRAQHEAGGTSYSGYQAQALIWRTHDGKPPYSRQFMETVGRDVIVYEHDQRKDQWAAGGARLPILDLAGALGLNLQLRPGSHMSGPDMKGKFSVVEDLFHAAKHGREASHALLDHTPAGWKESVLSYLLTTRWRATHHLKDYKPIRDMLTTATTGQDATSQKLATEMIKIISGQVHEAVGKAPDGTLEIKNRELFDRYLPLGLPLGRAIAANIDQLSRLILNHKTFNGVTATDMSFALVMATADDVAFEELIRAQTEHMRAALDTVPPVGLDAGNAERLGFTKADVKQYDFNLNGVVDKDDVLRFLEDRAVEEAEPFGFLTEIRKQGLIAQGLNDKKADEALKGMVGSALGLLPVPGAKYVGELAKGAFGDMLGKGYDKFAGAAYDEIAKQVAQRMFVQGRTMDEAQQSIADNQLAVFRLGEQMLATALLNKSVLNGVNIRNEPFTTGNPPALKPFAEMTPDEYGQFLAWARKRGGTSGLLNRFDTTLHQTDKVTAHLGLNDPPPTGDSQ
ncbi:hypothetical protein SAMN05444920_101416 [Nonomuraea solani]|uniref:Uncharacterized protein n=1 Tax=Nonomuraea solani TaxID=1144553 RepID=A0A1H5U5D5_9ACTN|nr:hypothetical protein [Nonomuraea solani]SEF70266.1 hypothetical protein SAMN05444920_101416 [Nonomuraea solani]